MADSTTPPGWPILAACAVLIYLPTAALKAWFGFWSLASVGGKGIAAVDFGGDDE
jgi:hypothetical protein